MALRSSGIRRVTSSQGERRALSNQARNAGIPWSAYTPAEARSDTETRPMRTAGSVPVAALAAWLA